ncbi:MAG: hypothetical protein JJU21_01445 [Salinarimonas sp.]|nr:hypothetical protein [Salinarimonas sp.]
MLPSKYSPVSLPVALLGLMLIWLLLSLFIGLPPFLDAMFGLFHWGFALEVGFAFAVIALVQMRREAVPNWLIHLFAAIGTFLLALRLADLTAQSVVNRSLNMFLDVSLLPALWDVAVTLLGRLVAFGAVTGVALMLVLFYVLAVWGLRRASGLLATGQARRSFALVCVAGIVVFTAQRTVFAEVPGWRPFGASASLVFHQQSERLVGTIVRRATFRADLARDPADAIPQDRILADLGDRDVLIVYVESYGVTALDEPSYAEVVMPRLEELDNVAAQTGFEVTSGRMVAASVGGQSWLNHATLSSGRFVDDQTLYALFLSERPRTLVHDFEATGRRTVQLKPAITMPWPEGQRLGYQATWEAADMGYEGPEFYWGIVPDQFALDFFARTELEIENRPPVFASLALISSHAPWLPVPDVVEWDELGDGSVYERWTRGAPEARVVWRSQDRVREQFALSIAHSIDVVAKFLRDRVDTDALVIVLGDHQPAPLVTGPDASRAVPVHIFSGDREVLEPFSEIGFVPGILPEREPEGGDAALPRMDDFRPFLLDAFSREPLPGS